MTSYGMSLCIQLSVNVPLPDGCEMLHSSPHQNSMEIDIVVRY